jgi:hypothetical protein
MANRFPLIVDSAALQIKELPSGDNIDMTGSSIESAASIGSTNANITGISTLNNVNITGFTTVSGDYDIQNSDGQITAGIVTASSTNVAGLSTTKDLIVTGISSVGSAITMSGADGSIQANSFVKSGGTSSQYLMADGSTTVGGGGGGSGVEILDEGSSVGTGITILDFQGSDVAAVVSGAAATITVTSSGGGGGGLSTTGVSTAMIWSNPSVILQDVSLDTGNYNYGVFGPLTVDVGATVTVGAANTFVIV